MKKLFGLALMIVAITSMGGSQAISVNGGSIQGTITDTSGAVVPNSQIVIRGTDTGSIKNLTTDSAGFYSVGPLNPGNYTVSVASPGFQKLDVKTVVRTGTVTSGSFKLTVGQSSETVEVNAGELQVNTEQAGVSDVLTHEQIQSLPINGRNFLDVAQIEPGVILQSGETFDPTKAGYSAISVGGVSGRTTRILLDGQDITDETVGTTIFNVSQGSINEFQLNRSTQDVSGDVTSTGQLLVATVSGTNSVHGQLFYNFQDHRALFATAAGQDAPFQRNQFGGSVGGPIIKDRLFFFGNAERIKQDASTPPTVSPTFAALPGFTAGIPGFYRETYTVVRLDYSGPFGGHYFARANYNVNSVAGNYGSGYNLYANRDNTPGIAAGADFQSGRFTHSFRGSYEKFHNLITDATSGSSLPNLLPGITFQYVNAGIFTGPNYLAPQGTFQSDKQLRYDGTWTKGQHSLKYGYSVNRILGGGFANFFSLGPRLRETASTAFKGPTATNPNALGCGGVAGAAPCLSDPLNGYHASSFVVGNGLGFFVEKPGFGLLGGNTSDWREAAYLSDSWKATPSLTLTVGVRYTVDTGRANQDLPEPLCSDIDTTNVFTDATQLPCTGSKSLFGAYGSQYAGRVHQPYNNFAPQAGFAYAPGDHKTSLRGAYGIFYEGDVFNNTTNARTSLLKSGPFFNSQSICAQGGTLFQPDGTRVTSLTVGGSTQTLSQVCAGSIKNAAPFTTALEAAYQANTQKNITSQNGGYIGETLAVAGIYGAPYKSPYSQQWNFGIQREISKGSILSADYVHNSTLRIGQSIDVNHVGAARTLNPTAARAAIAAVTAKRGCSGGASSAAINCAIAAGATIQTFAQAGLDSGITYLGGEPASANGLTVATGAAFPGVNPLLGQGNFILPIGKTGYDALQVVLRQMKSHPVAFVDSANVQISYNLSRIVANNTGGAGGSTSDAFFNSLSFDNDNPSAFVGRAGLDHKHQVSFGGSFRLKYGPQIGAVGHFYSAAPADLTLTSGLTAGTIFQTDVTGDGTTGDIAPGTLPGDYMHRVKPGTLGTYIQNFNSTVAGNLTPAGQALVNAGLFTASQLAAVGGVIQPIPQLTTPRAIGNPSVRDLDLNFSYPVRLNRFHEGMSLEPAIAFYNVGNFSNFKPFAGTLDGGSGSVNGPNTPGELYARRIVRGNGTFDQNAPRSTEFQLRLNF